MPSINPFIKANHPGRKRRIMQAFKLNELSAVDKPAQVGARMTIMKRDTQETPMQLPAREHPEVVVRKIEPAPRDTMTFEDAVAEIRKREGCSKLDAMRKAARQHPELLESFQKAVPKGMDRLSRPMPPLVGERRGIDRLQPTQAQSRAIHAFEDRWQQLRKDRRLSATDAMKLARTMYPDEFAAYRRA